MTRKRTTDAHPAEVARNRRAVEASEIASRLCKLPPRATAELLLDYDRRLAGEGLNIAARYAAIERAALHVTGADQWTPGPSLVAEKDKAKP
jgi:hypothetical protein